MLQRQRLHQNPTKQRWVIFIELSTACSSSSVPHVSRLSSSPWRQTRVSLALITVSSSFPLTEVALSPYIYSRCISCTLGHILFISITQSSRSLDEWLTSFHLRTVHFVVMRSFLSVWYYTIIFGTRETRISHFLSRILHIFVKKQIHLHFSYLTNVPSSTLMMIVLIDDIVLSISICP